MRTLSLFLTVVVAMIFISAGVVGASFHVQSSQEVERERADLQELANNVAGQLGRMLHDEATDVTSAGASPAITPHGTETQRAVLTQLFEKQTYLYVTVADQNGTVVESITQTGRPNRLADANVSNHTHFQRAIAGETYISPIQRTPAGDPVVVISAPVDTSETESAVGVVSAYVELDTAALKFLVGPYESPSQTVVITANEEVLMRPTTRIEHNITASAPVSPTNVRVTIIRDRTALDNSIQSMLSVHGAVFAGVFLIIIAGGLFFFRIQHHQYERLYSGIEAATDGNYGEAHVDLEWGNEWRAVSEQFNSLVETLSAREKRLKGEIKKFETLFSGIPTPAIAVKFEDGTPLIVNANAEFEHDFRVEDDETYPVEAGKYIVADDEYEPSQSIIDQLTSGESVETEVVRTLDGVRQHFILSATPVESSDADADAFVMYVNITDQVTKKRRLAVLYRVLRHDLRNAMQVILGKSGEIAEQADDPAATDAEQIGRRARKLLEISETVQHLEKSFQSRRDVITRQNVADTVVEAVEEVRASWPDATVEIDHVDETTVHAVEHFSDVVREVIANAIEHNDAVDPWVGVSVTDQGDAVKITFEDNGPRLSEVEKQLFQNPEAQTKLQHSTGIGLWLVVWGVNQSGGTVNIEDRMPRGTRITLELPKSVDLDEDLDD
ncbi:MAG: ATP-binding protein [Halopenitus sp.]